MLLDIQPEEAMQHSSEGNLPKSYAFMSKSKKLGVGDITF